MPQLDVPVVAKSADSVPVPAPSSPTPSDNHVYFTSHVDTDTVVALMKQIRDVETNLRTARVAQRIPDDWPKLPIYLHVSSGGGGLFAGLSAADQLEAIKWPIVSIVEGYTCSAATLISMSCQQRTILPGSYMLIHQLFSVSWGNYEQLKDDMRINDMLMEQLWNFYARRSNLKLKEVKKRLKHDYWMSAQQALNDGFVDAIYRPM